MAASAVRRYRAPLSSTDQPSARATRWATVPLPEAVGPSMAITGTALARAEDSVVMAIGLAGHQAGVYVEIIGEGLAYAARVEDAHRRRAEGSQRKAHRHAMVVVRADVRVAPGAGGRRRHPQPVGAGF